MRERIIRSSMPLLVCALAISVVCAQPPTAPVMRPPTTSPPQNLLQSIQAGGKEVIVDGQSMGFYNVGALAPQPVTLTSLGAPTAAQAAFWSDWYKATLYGTQTQGRDVAIIARAADGHEVQRWTLQGARPIKFGYSPLAQPGTAPTLTVSLIYTNVVNSL
ncbi:MAG TPA: hypothetical protein VEU78_04120 [Steroidobacteraceae bacterium]|nr:hypothetical protein [Steroidobacteraceae bacterium]